MDEQKAKRRLYKGLRMQQVDGLVEREVDGGFLYYKQGYDFLTQASSWVELAIDGTVVPKARIWAAEGNLFAERAYYAGEDFRRLEWLLKTLAASYDRMKFEQVIGIKTASKGDDLIYHTWGPGLVLADISAKTPPPMAEEIAKLLAKAMRELHEGSVQYTETVPTNFKYAFGDEIILNPHNCMSEMGSGLSRKDQIVDDLAIILCTHGYIKDKPGFLAEYNAKPSDFDDVELRRMVLGFLGHVPELISTGELPIADAWAGESRRRQSGKT